LPHYRVRQHQSKSDAAARDEVPLAKLKVSRATMVR
jgi:hypothetical protein